jgi:hypothetical protein
MTLLEFDDGALRAGSEHAHCVGTSSSSFMLGLSVLEGGDNRAMVAEGVPLSRIERHTPPQTLRESRGGEQVIILVRDAQAARMGDPAASQTLPRSPKRTLATRPRFRLEAWLYCASGGFLRRNVALSLLQCAWCSRRASYGSQNEHALTDRPTERAQASSS